MFFSVIKWNEHSESSDSSSFPLWTSGKQAPFLLTNGQLGRVILNNANEYNDNFSK